MFNQLSKSVYQSVMGTDTSRVELLNHDTLDKKIINISRLSWFMGVLVALDYSIAHEGLDKRLRLRITTRTGEKFTTRRSSPVDLMDFVGSNPDTLAYEDPGAYVQLETQGIVEKDGAIQFAAEDYHYFEIADVYRIQVFDSTVELGIH